MSFSKKKVWLAILVVMILTVVLAYLSRNGVNPVSKTVNYIITPIESKFSQVFNPISDVFSYIGKLEEYEEENQRLNRENIELSSKIKDIKTYQEENDRLRKLLAITDEYDKCETVAARVVGYETDNWFSYVTIDKGTSSGINISDTVITADGLLGQVTDVGSNWSKVSTIINSESSAGVRITRNGEIGIVEGDTTLSKSNRCRLGYLTANASIIAGDILKTSGLGGIYPPGVPVGKITEISKDNMGRLDYAVVEPFINFDKLYEVVVLTEWSMKTIPEGNIVVESTITENVESNEEMVDDTDNQNVG